MSGESDCEEGCLSVPGIYDKVKRAERITVKAQNTKGESFGYTSDVFKLYGWTSPIACH